jgi:hypothetical protein
MDLVVGGSCVHRTGVQWGGNEGVRVIDVLGVGFHR